MFSFTGCEATFFSISQATDTSVGPLCVDQHMVPNDAVCMSTNNKFNNIKDYWRL